MPDSPAAQAYQQIIDSKYIDFLLKIVVIDKAKQGM